MFVVLTNDDGIYSKGLRYIYKALLGAGHQVQVIAPLGEQSGMGHALTVFNPLRVKPVEEEGFSGLAVNGTPADCVKLGLSRLAARKPDLLLSGINAGGNVGPDILYSGTVSAAAEGAAMGCPSLAVSHNSRILADTESYARFTVGLIPKIPWAELPLRRALNLNFPSCPLGSCRGLRVCPQTSAVWRDWYDERKDPRGQSCWWMNGVIPRELVEPGTDKDLLEQGWATLTPLKFEFTDYAGLDLLSSRLGPESPLS
ncbi:MAG: 5'/3'-nucleotidase SurE [Deltaproteobacteria bacterium]|nr:5'/3'-nucleotidase SurE [Deltaproteobacteria bacterium]